MDTLFSSPFPASIDLLRLAANLVLSLALATALAWYYARYGRALSNRARFAATLPLLAVTTALVFTMIRSSAALALGLVGALSIVRFRTAIKEPEELLYLFVAIAIGLGMGAEQQVATILALGIIMGYLALKEITSPPRLESNLYVDVVSPEGSSSFSDLTELIRRHAATANLRRLDRRDSTIQATFLLESPSDATVLALMDDLRRELPESEFSFVEQDNNFAG